MKAQSVNPAERARAKRLRDLFNISIAEYAKILKFQKGKCPITDKAATQFYVDHCHHSGLVRGLLSLRANKGLAYFNDDPAMLRRAAEYLENPPAVAALKEKVYGVIGRVTRKAKNRRYGPDGSKMPQPRNIA